MTARIEARLVDILARVGRVDPALLSRDTDLGALGLDSILMVEVIFAIEESFDISMPYSTDAGPLFFGALADQVAGLVAARG